MSEETQATSDSPLVVLLDTAPRHVDAYQHIFKAMQVNLAVAENAAELNRLTQLHAPVLVLIDAGVSDPDPFQIINGLKADRKTAHIPVVLATSGFSDKRLALHPELAASIELLPKPFEIDKFFALIRFFVTQYEYRCLIDSIGENQGSSLIESDCEGIVALDEEGKICFVNYAAECMLRGRASFLVGKFVESILDEPAPALVSHWQEHPINTVTRSEQILQVDSAAFWRVDGQSTRVKFAAIPLRDRGDIKHVIAFRELKETRESRDKLTELSHACNTTGLPTRVRIEEALDKLLRKNRTRNQYCAVLHLDLDHFRYINESVGHELGDQMLVQVANRIKALIRREDVLGRLEGDEFVVLLSYIERPENAGVVARKLVERLHEPYLLEGHEIYSSCSIGIAVYPQCGDDVAALMKNAEAAAQRAKLWGRNTCQYFTLDMNRELAERVQLEFDLHRAFEKKQFNIVLVPVMDVASEKLQALEISLQWQHPQRGLLDLRDFRLAVDDAGLSADLCRWIWQEGLLAVQHRLHDPAHAGENPLLLLPATPALLSQEDAAEWLMAVNREVGFDASRVVILLPEAAAMVREREATEAVLALKRHGFEFALDEFGTGFAPLHMLRKIPFTYVRLSDKILHGIGQLPTDEAIIDGVLYLARQLGLQVVATGVSDAAQGRFLWQRGCTWWSGSVLDSAAEGSAEQTERWAFMRPG